MAAELAVNEWRGRTSLELQASGLRPAGPLALAGAPVGAAVLPRLNPREAMTFLKTGAAAYAENGVAAYLRDNVPGLTLLDTGAAYPGGELILYTLPPEATLRRWLEEAQQQGGRVSFALGPKTLGELDAALTLASLLPDFRSDAAPEAAADAYRCWQWAHHYRVLDDAGWTASVYAMLGLPGSAALPETAEALALAVG